MAIQSASTGPVGGARMQYHLRMALGTLDAQVLGKPEIFVNFANKKIDDKTGDITDAPTKRLSQIAACDFRGVH